MSALMEFIDRIIQRFPPSFRWDDVQKNAWTEDMVRELDGFSADVLTKTWQQMVRTRGLKKDEKTTPTVAECIAACKETEHWIKAEEHAKRLKLDAGKGGPPVVGPDGQDTGWSESRFKWVLTLIDGELGRRAAKEEWILALFNFTYRNNTLPKLGPEIEKLRREHAEWLGTYKDLLTGNNWPAPAPMRGKSTFALLGDYASTRQALVRYGDGFLIRMKRLSEWIERDRARYPDVDSWWPTHRKEYQWAA